VRGTLPDGADAFGVLDSSRPCFIRPGAYAIIQDASGRVAVVQTPRGSFFPAEAYWRMKSRLTASRASAERNAASPSLLLLGSATSSNLWNSDHRTVWLDPENAWVMTREFERTAMGNWAVRAGGRRADPIRIIARSAPPYWLDQSARGARAIISCPAMTSSSPAIDATVTSWPSNREETRIAISGERAVA
jgi:hypothetical protein